MIAKAWDWSEHGTREKKYEAGGNEIELTEYNIPGKGWKLQYPSHPIVLWTIRDSKEGICLSYIPCIAFYWIVGTSLINFLSSRHRITGNCPNRLNKT